MRRYIAEQGGRTKLSRRYGDAGRKARLARRSAPARPEFAGLRRLILCGLAALIFTFPAFAGPWVQDKGGAYLRASFAFEDHDGPEAGRQDLYTEWGVTRNWTFSAKYEAVDFQDSDPFDSEGWRLTARRKLWTGKRFVTSAEFGVLEGAALGGFRGCESRGLELGFGAGFSSATVGQSSYAGMVVSRREHEDDCYHNRVELVFGHSPDGKWYRTIQLWSERGADDASDKLELMVSRRIGHFEAGLAFREEIGGDFEETATVVSLAWRPMFGKPATDN